MRRLLGALAALLLIPAASRAETIKVTVGHMCCGDCKAAAMAGLKTLEWAQNVEIDGTMVMVTAKEKQPADVVSLLDALNKAGFPANEMASAGPVTLTLTHLCCPGCANDLKAKIAELRTQALDKGSVKIDTASKTVVLRPLAGKTLNLVVLLNQIERAGFSARKAVMTPLAATRR